MLNIIDLILPMRNVNILIKNHNLFDGKTQDKGEKSLRENGLENRDLKK